MLTTEIIGVDFIDIAGNNYSLTAMKKAVIPAVAEVISYQAVLAVAKGELHSQLKLYAICLLLSNGMNYKNMTINAKI